MTTLRGLLLDRADDDGVALVVDDRRWTWSEFVGDAARRAHWLLDQDRDDHGHVGVLMGNTAEFALLLAAGALAAVPIVGLNPTRRGAELARDIARTRCGLLCTDSLHGVALRGIEDLPSIAQMESDRWAAAIAERPVTVPSPETDPTEATFVLVLTSGTTGHPKAVRRSQTLLAAQGAGVARIADLTADDVVYCAMPLFHSNAITAGWGAAVASGATLALRESFSASGFMEDVRRYGATYANYVGTPLSWVLAQPERPDDGDNPLRVVFGNEAAPSDVTRFAERFGCRVIEAYGSSEGGVSVSRTPDTPPGALGVAQGDVRILDPLTGEECPPAVLDAEGRVLNPDDAIGEMVRVDGTGAFEGYFDDEDAEADRVRDGWYWTGDLAYRDTDGFLWFAGRTNGWVRVRGENLAVGPIERILVRCPAVTQVAVVGVPNPTAGDDLVGVLAVPSVAAFDVDGFAQWMRDQSDLAPLWRPTWLRVVADLPTTGTNKIDRRRLAGQGLHPDTDFGRELLLVIDDHGYRAATATDLRERREAFARAGRSHLLDDART